MAGNRIEGFILSAISIRCAGIEHDPGRIVEHGKHLPGIHRHLGSETGHESPSGPLHGLG